MSAYLAVSAALDGARPQWTRTTFRRVTTQSKRPNADSDEPLLSLSSTGEVAVRGGEDGLGRQAPSESTIRDYWKVRPEQVVVNPMWLVGGSVGVSQTSGAVSPAYRVYSIDRSRLHPRYLHYLLRSYPYLEQYRVLGRGDTTFDRSVGREEFEGLPVLLPPLEEQRRIADFLDDQVTLLDRALTLRQQQVSLAQERLKSAISQVYDWQAPDRRRVRVQDLLSAPPCYGVLVPSFVDEGVPFIRINDLPAVERGEQPALRIPKSLSDEYKRTVVQAGDVLASVVGTLGAAVVVGEGAAGSNVNRAICRLRPASGVPSLLLRGYFLSAQFDFEARQATGSGTAQATLNMGDLRKFSVGVPSDTAGFASAADAVGKVLHAHQRLDTLVRQSLALLGERKQALITAAVMGQFDVAAARKVSVA